MGYLPQRSLKEPITGVGGKVQATVMGMETDLLTSPQGAKPEAAAGEIELLMESALLLRQTFQRPTSNFLLIGKVLVIIHEEDFIGVDELPVQPEEYDQYRAERPVLTGLFQDARQGKAGDGCCGFSVGLSNSRSTL